jgi:CheY-like chemotaxis protein
VPTGPLERRLPAFYVIGLALCGLQRAGAMAKILVIDDHEPIRVLLQHMLASDGHAVATAADGREAMAMLGDKGYDLVITDIFMPAQDGFETIMQLHGDFPGVRVLAMSGGTFSVQGRGQPAREIDVLELAERYGVAAVLRKPFGKQELLSLVREVLSSTPVSEAPRTH